MCITTNEWLFLTVVSLIVGTVGGTIGYVYNKRKRQKLNEERNTSRACWLVSMEIKGLTEEQLEELYFKTVEMRENVLKLVDEFGYNANQLVSRTFEQDIEKEYGRKSLKKKQKILQLTENLVDNGEKNADTSQ